MKKEHPCVTKMMKTLATDKGRESYAYKLQRFMAFAAEKKYVKHNEDFESLLTYEPEQLTDILEDFVNYLESQVKEFLKFGINSVVGKPSDLHTLLDIEKDMWLR